MGQPSFPASNALIYSTYGAFLLDQPAHSPYSDLSSRQLTVDTALWARVWPGGSGTSL